MSSNNYVQVVVPKHRHKRMRVTESWAGTAVKSGMRQYDICKVCYKKMRRFYPWITVLDFTHLPGGGILLDDLLDDIPAEATDPDSEGDKSSESKSLRKLAPVAPSKKGSSNDQ